MASTLEPPEAPARHGPPKRSLWQRITGSRFLIISIAAHLLFGLLAAAYVVQTIAAKRKLTFTAAPPSPNPSTRLLEHKVQMAKKQNTMSAPVQSKRITTTGLAKVSLPEMPAMPSMNTMTAPGRMAGMGGTGAGLGSGAGALGSGGGLGGGPVPLFGLRGGGGLAGTFYDLKQTSDGKPTAMALQPDEQGKKFNIKAPVNLAYDRVLSAVVAGGMSENSLNKYFRGPQTLSLTQLFIPSVKADEAPKAFNLGDKVKGRRWVIVYRGKVTAPESGRYRFAGFGDDILVVRLDNRVVLDASYAPPTKKQSPPYGKPIAGQTVEIRSGSAYTMEVMIGERPGGEYNGYLLVEKEGAQLEKDKGGAPLLPIFKLAPSPMPKPGPILPPVAADTSWSVWKGEAVKSIGF